MILYRLASLSFPIFDGTGAAMHGARWNSIGLPVIYAATSLAGAKLELLAHIGFDDLPRNFGYVKIGVPDGLAVTTYWGKSVPKLSRSIPWGDEWLRDKRTLLAKVPSAASPGEHNFLINPAHPDLGLLKVGPQRKVRWDSRHFKAVSGK